MILEIFVCWYSVKMENEKSNLLIFSGNSKLSSRKNHKKRGVQIVHSAPMSPNKDPMM